MHVCMDMRLGPSTSVRMIAKSAFQGVRNKGFHCSTLLRLVSLNKVWPVLIVH